MQDVEVPALIVRVADVSCAIPCAHVVETMRAQPLTPLDGMPPFVRGLAIIRGESMPVADLAALLGRYGGGTRFVTVRADRRAVALAVDDVVGVARFRAGDFAARPQLLTESPHAVVHALARKDQALHLVLNATRLIDHVTPPA